MNETEYLHIIMHNKASLIPSWKALVGSADKLLFQTKKKFFMRASYSFTRKKLFLLNTKTQQCSTQSNYSLSHCLNSAIMNKLKCQLPWYKGHSGK